MSTPLIGEHLGKYQVIEKLGTGALADVYRGLQVGLDRDVALKVLPVAFASDRDMVQRFRQEFQVAARLSHPNIITIYDSGLQDGHHYYVMEFLQPESLEDLLEKQGSLPAARAMRIAQDVLKALVYLHEKGFVHRSLVAAGIKFDLRENAILTDFGALEPIDSERADAGELVREDLHGVGLAVGRMIGPRPPEEVGTFLARATGVKGRSDFATAKEMLAELKRVELRERARRLASRTGATAAGAATGPMRRPEPFVAAPTAEAGSGSDSCVSSLAWSRDRRALLSLLRVAVPVFALGVLTTVWLVGLILGPAAPGLLEQSHDCEPDRVAAACRTDRPCFVWLEVWPADDPSQARRSESSARPATEHRLAIGGLRSGTRYGCRFLFSREAGGAGDAGASGVFEVTTPAELRITNIAVDAGVRDAVVSWETSLGSDSVVRFGREPTCARSQDSSDQDATKVHSVSLGGLEPGTSYHYRIVATGSPGRRTRAESATLQFTTRLQQAGLSGLSGLVRSYIDKLSRMTPDERSKLRESLAQFDRRHFLTAERKAQLAAGRTDPRREDVFYERLVGAGLWIIERFAERQGVDRWLRDCRIIESLYHTNRVVGARRLDALIRDVAASRGERRAPAP
jgi:tRNA A-37 threonylcarbamoyl transferase component Bud32